MPIKDLSAGEKRQALLSFTISLLSKTTTDDKNSKIIFALDEPEASLHISRIFDQFEALKEIAGSVEQVLATTHWYGFIPIIDEGWVQSLNKDDDGIEIDSIDLSDFHQTTRKMKTGSQGERPFDSGLKGYSELVQSIINSVCRTSEPYRWLICEGTTDKIYIQKFLTNFDLPHLRIVPLAGVKNVIKMFRLLQPVVQDDKAEMQTSIVCLVDTDENLLPMDGIKDIKGKLMLRRLCNVASEGDQTVLLSPESQTTGLTTIEDVLPPQTYLKALKTFEEEIGITIPGEPALKDAVNSFQSLDLKGSERKRLKDFLESDNGRNKVRLARRFVDLYDKAPEEPAWIKDLAALLK